MKLALYNQSTIHALGKCQIRLINPKNRKKYRVHFVVIDDVAAVPLLGLRAAQQMNLLKIQYHNISALDNQSLTRDMVSTKYADIFREKARRLSGEVHLKTDPTVEPVKLPLRRVPVALKQELRKELNRQENLGVIAAVDTPTDWVSSFVLVKKPNGKLRICIDPKPLNKALKRNHYPLPVIEDILPDLAQAKTFSLFEVKNGCWRVELDEELSFLTTFETPHGRFRWRRLPFGISPASEYFQQSLEQALEKLPGVHVVADDILVAGYGATEEEAHRDHDMRVTERCRKMNITLNKQKFKFKCTEMPYIGHALTTQGLKPDPAKVEAILQMPRPTDLAGVQRLIGFVNDLVPEGAVRPLRANQMSHPQGC